MFIDFAQLHDVNALDSLLSWEYDFHHYITKDCNTVLSE